MEYVIVYVYVYHDRQTLKPPHRVSCSTISFWSVSAYGKYRGEAWVGTVQFIQYIYMTAPEVPTVPTTNPGPQTRRLGAY